jgi:hypothetical protein
MATFHIHQDVEKENSVNALISNKTSVIIGKDKIQQQRSTFAVSI